MRALSVLHASVRSVNLINLGPLISRDPWVPVIWRGMTRRMAAHVFAAPFTRRLPVFGRRLSSPATGLYNRRDTVKPNAVRFTWGAEAPREGAIESRQPLRGPTTWPARLGGVSW